MTTSFNDLDGDIHRALTRVHDRREALAMRHGEAEARLYAYEAELFGEGRWLANGDDNQWSRRALS